MALAPRALEALGDATRRAIVERLVAGPRSVGELAAALPVSRPAVSQHLRVLREAGLVESRPEGTRRIYALDPAGVEAVRAYLDRLWSASLRAFGEEVSRSWARRRRSGEGGGGSGRAGSQAGRGAAQTNSEEER